MTLAPEVVAEQIMGYVVGASELIPTLKPSPNKSYSVAILPQGPHFYTGLLQAAGYLLLDNKKKKLLILSQQADDPSHSIIDTTAYGPIFGQTRKNSIMKIKNIAHDIGLQIGHPEQKSLYEQIRAQLPFIRTIMENKEFVHISIGEKTPQNILNRIAGWIKNNGEEYSIVLLTNIEVNTPAKSKRTDEQNKIAKIIQTVSPKTPLLTIFQKILTAQKKKPEIIAYVNPGDFGKPTSLTTRYICAVG